MFTPRVRVVFGIILIGFTIYFLMYSNWLSAGLSLFGFILTISGYYTNGTVYLAFQQLRKDNLKKADELISLTSNPQLLKKSNRSIYFFIKGATSHAKNKVADSKSHFKEALDIGIKTENMKSIALLNLASFAVNEKEWALANEHIQEIKSLKYSSDLTPKITELERRIKKKK